MLRFFVQSCAALAAAAVAQLCLATSDLAQEADKPMVTLQPDPARDVMPFYRDWTKSPEAEPRLTREQTIERLRAAVKYVFVIFHENESFDHYRDIPRCQWNLLRRPASAGVRRYAWLHPNL